VRRLDVKTQRKSLIKRIYHGFDRRLEECDRRLEGWVEEWRRQDAARQASAEVARDELWAEAVERERLLAEAVGEEEARRTSLGEVTERRVFVVHSKEASEALGAFARERHRLVRVVPGSEGTGAGVKGSWLVFEASK
jgi:hypothetical protein